MSILGRIFGRGAKAPEPRERNDDALLVNAYATLRDLPPLDFPHQLNARRDLSDPELAPHLDGFAGYVLGRGNGQMTATRYHLWRHIQRVRHQVSFGVAGPDLARMQDWARKANAVLFLPDGSVRAPDMATLTDAGGESDANAQLPYPADALDRRARTLELLKDVSPAPPAGMPPCLGEAEAVLRPAAEVLKRALALFCVAAYADGLRQGEADSAVGIRQDNPVGIGSLSPAEQAFFDSASPDAQTVSAMSWRVEALNVLLWVLSLHDAGLDQASTTANVAAMAQIVREIARDENPARQVHLRPAADILDALDMAWRQHWVVRQAQQKGVSVENPNPDIVMERHFALNWLTGFHNAPGTAWDETDTPT